MNVFVHYTKVEQKCAAIFCSQIFSKVLQMWINLKVYALKVFSLHKYHLSKEHIMIYCNTPECGLYKHNYPVFDYFMAKKKWPLTNWGQGAILPETWYRHLLRGKPPHHCCPLTFKSLVMPLVLRHYICFSPLLVPWWEVTWLCPSLMGLPSRLTRWIKCDSLQRKVPCVGLHLFDSQTLQPSTISTWRE